MSSSQQAAISIKHTPAALQGIQSSSSSCSSYKSIEVKYSAKMKWGRKKLKIHHYLLIKNQKQTNLNTHTHTTKWELLIPQHIKTLGYIKANKQANYQNFNLFH